MQVRLSSARMQPYESRAHECVARGRVETTTRVNPEDHPPRDRLSGFSQHRTGLLSTRSPEMICRRREDGKTDAS
jgi:hypothetical protein